MKLHTTNQYSFINRDNRVPHYQRLYQRNDGVRIWKRVGQDFSALCSRSCSGNGDLGLERNSVDGVLFTVTTEQLLSIPVLRNTLGRLCRYAASFC